MSVNMLQIYLVYIDDCRNDIRETNSFDSARKMSRKIINKIVINVFPSIKLFVKFYFNIFSINTKNES